MERSGCALFMHIRAYQEHIAEPTTAYTSRRREAKRRMRRRKNSFHPLHTCKQQAAYGGGDDLHLDLVTVSRTSGRLPFANNNSESAPICGDLFHIRSSPRSRVCVRIFLLFHFHSARCTIVSKRDCKKQAESESGKTNLRSSSSRELRRLFLLRKGNKSRRHSRSTIRRVKSI
jgi:hypothetical protein